MLRTRRWWRWLIKACKNTPAPKGCSPTSMRLSDLKSNEHNSLAFGQRRCGELNVWLPRLRPLHMKNVEIMIPFVRTLDRARAMGDLLNDERMRIQMAHLCFLVCSAANCICYSDAAFEPGLLTVSGCAYTCPFFDNLDS